MRMSARDWCKVNQLVCVTLRLGICGMEESPFTAEAQGLTQLESERDWWM